MSPEPQESQTDCIKLESAHALIQSDIIRDVLLHRSEKERKRMSLWSTNNREGEAATARAHQILTTQHQHHPPPAAGATPLQTFFFLQAVSRFNWGPFVPVTCTGQGLPDSRVVGPMVEANLL
eukprot:1008039-Pelagomonas_calceolata.AAC.1